VGAALWGAWLGRRAGGGRLEVAPETVCRPSAGQARPSVGGSYGDTRMSLRCAGRRHGRRQPDRV
jgi:hypothetical protein